MTKQKLLPPPPKNGRGKDKKPRRNKAQEQISALRHEVASMKLKIEVRDARIRVLEERTKHAEAALYAQKLMNAGMAAGNRMLRELAEKEGVELPPPMDFVVKPAAKSNGEEKKPDTSDIPEVDEDWFRRAKLKMPKLNWRVVEDDPQRPLDKDEVEIEVKRPDGWPKEMQAAKLIEGPKRRKRGDYKARRKTKLGAPVDRHIGTS